MMIGARWIIGLVALVLAGIAAYVLLSGGTGSNSERMMEITEPALDDIDAKSRRELRDLLRRADSEE